MKKLSILLFTVLSLALSAQTTDTAATQKCAGLFSVSPTMKVRFSPGNLQYQPSTHLCRFAAQQTEVIGWKPLYANTRYKGWIDLFGWGTAMNPTNYSEDAAEYTFFDWGFYCGLPTNGGKIWRTLSAEEWSYLLGKRPHARRLYAIAYVDKHYGIVLLPDDWKCPKGLYLKTGPKEDQANWISAERWAQFEAAGAVFLPSEEKRVGTNAEGSATRCHYWTTTASNKKPTEACYLLVDPYVPQFHTANKSTGLSVRLVQEI